MIVHAGIYSWKRKIVAFRNDHCLTCRCQRLAYQYRSFDALHVFFVPILPLGFWKRWRCSTCGADPHQRVGTGRAYKWVGVALLLFIGVSVWLAPPGEDLEGRVLCWTLRFGLPVAFAFALHATLASPPDVNLEEQLRKVAPIAEASCPLCGEGLLPTEPAWRCPRCGIERRVLNVSHG